MKTIKEREKIFNECYSQISEDAVVNEFFYFTNKKRIGKHCTEMIIRKAYRNGTIGRLVKKYDSIRFYSL